MTTEQITQEQDLLPDTYQSSLLISDLYQMWECTVINKKGPYFKRTSLTNIICRLVKHYLQIEKMWQDNLTGNLTKIKLSILL